MRNSIVRPTTIKQKLLQLFETKPRLMGALIVIVVATFWSGFLANKSLPTAEGWYSYYAQRIIAGDTVYKDFEYLFTPLYMYFVTFIIKIFGTEIMVLRIMGILFYDTIALLLYGILVEVFRCDVGVIAALAGIFYLQSEVYTVFYDYVRLMDIFSYGSLLLLIKAIKAWRQNKYRETNICIVLCGVCASLYALTKQNMGVLSATYYFMAIILFGFLFKQNFKTIIKSVVYYGLAFSVPVFLFCTLLFFQGILGDMVNSVFFSALDAKGGVMVVLFRWIKLGFPSYVKSIPVAMVYLLGLLCLRRLSTLYYEEELKTGIYRRAILCFLFLILGLAAVCYVRSFGEMMSSMQRWDATLLFIINILVLCYTFGCTLIRSLTDCNVSLYEEVVLLISGAFFALCYGAGMSGGLSVGESALGVALLVGLFMDSIRFKNNVLLVAISYAYVVFNILICCSFKMVYPCQWWCIDESSIYEMHEKTSVPNMSGIKVSASERDLYEGVVNIILENSSKDECIYCFPHIPVFYTLSDRVDPGVHAKVQWFDVSDNETLRSDAKIIETTSPKVIVIYNLDESTYQGHEDAFNGSKESGTRYMRDYLYKYVNENDYELMGRFVSDSNDIVVFVNKRISLDSAYEGSGTQEDPYVIESELDLINLSMYVNQGNSCEGCYFKQTKSIDLSNVWWIPIGAGKTGFKGKYDNGGYKVLNVNNGEKNSSNSYGSRVFYYKYND